MALSESELELELSACPVRGTHNVGFAERFAAIFSCLLFIDALSERGFQVPTGPPLEGLLGPPGLLGASLENVEEDS